MTSQQVENLITIIRAYYPTKKILDNPLEVMVWEDEFVNYDNDRVIEATRMLCRTTEDHFDINIASIKNKINDLQRGRKQEEDTKRYLEQWENVPLPDKDRSQKISEKIEQCKKELTQAK